MHLDPVVSRWQSAIIEACVRTLGRPLTASERTFIASRAGFVALEMIHDEVKHLEADPVALARYLNSESGSSPGPSV